jgi:hypothetical protein
MNTDEKQERGPACWKVAPGVVWIQVHQPDQARALAQIGGGRQVVRSVAGPYLRTFEFSRSLRWAKSWAESWVRRHQSSGTATNEAFLMLAGSVGTAGGGRRSRDPHGRS